MGGGQNSERPNVERLIFRNFETSNIEITKVKLFDFLFAIQFLIFTSVWIFRTLKIYDNLSNWKFLVFWYFYKLSNFENFLIFNFFLIFKIINFWKFPNWIFFNLPNSQFLELFKLEVFGVVQIGKLRNFKIFAIWKIKVWLQKLAILELFVHSIFRIIRNFANSHICSLI